MHKLNIYMIVCGLYSGTALAIPQFLEEWQELYPSSRSGDRQCQLCHVNPQGGEPWNIYGFEIRDVFREQLGSSDIRAAIEALEDSDSDNDPQGLSNLEEINLNLDPGWSPGPTNLWIFGNGDALEGNPPPFLEQTEEALLCLPIKVRASSRISVICI